MQKRISETEKEQIVALYWSGQSVTSLCVQYNIPRSTIYFWIKQFQRIQAPDNSAISYKDYYSLKRHTEKLELKLEVINLTGCGTAAPLKEKLAILEELYGQYSVHVLCEALNVSRGTFYNHIFRKKDVTFYDKRREEIREQVKIVFEESKQRFGANKITAILAEQGIKTSPKYVASLMREMGLYSINTDSKRIYKKKIQLPEKRNILQRQFGVSEPNSVWVSDITCFKIKEIYYYLCVIIDLFSRKIVSYGISTNNSTYLVTSTFKKAFSARNSPKNLIFHSDRGMQYASNTFRNMLIMNNIVQSFSNTGRPHDNAVAESFFSSLKKEELYRTNYKSEREFRKSVDDYVDFYNTKRPHRTLAYRTPDQFEKLFSEEKRSA